MLKQYDAIKQKYADCILFFRLGDFYEMFESDAVEGSRILNLTLTKRQETPMCGLPYHAADNYIAKLTRAGKKVAVCEQLSDPTLPGIVTRDVVRVITPGTTFDTHILEDKKNHYIIAVSVGKGGVFGLACADITTGEFLLYDCADEASLEEELARLSPAECVVDRSEKNIPVSLRQYGKMPVFPHDMWESGEEVLKKQYGVLSLESFGFGDKKQLIDAAGLLLVYLKDTQKSDLSHVRAPKLDAHTDELIVDDVALKNLELIFNMRDHSKEGTLLSVLDKTKTAMGGRLLRNRIMHPSCSEVVLNNRLDAIARLIQNSSLSNGLGEALNGVLDIERLLSKLSIGAGNARDILGIGLSLKTKKVFEDLLQGECARDGLFGSLYSQLTQLSSLEMLSAQITRALIDEPPLSTKEGGMIRDGYDAELDELKKITRDGKQIIAEMQQKEIETTGINSLKIRYNNVFGYFVEVTKANLTKVPAHYIRKQTTVNGERFVTPELKELEEKILTAETKSCEIEYRLFTELRTMVHDHTRDLQNYSSVLANIDVLLSLSQVAQNNRYVRPQIVASTEALEIKEGRHPVIESLRSDHFIPNDVELSTERRCVVITGPNMGGKSTYLRQTALIVLMAHLGSFVPAGSAKIPLTDRIFTRVGASDNLVHGQSTFMVEMQETARILHYATPRSLIILDEIGRGTSTYDGVSLAWSILEYIHNVVGAKTLFATHYHELISVADTLPNARNMSVAIKEEKGTIVFLYRVCEGAINRSYGVEVARLAGLPNEVIAKAKEILLDLEEGIVDKAVGEKMASEVRQKKTDEAQIDMFAVPVDPRAHRIIKELDEANVDAMTPLEALNKLYELKKGS